MCYIINKLKSNQTNKEKHTVDTSSDGPILSTCFSDSFSSSLILTLQDLAFRFLTESNGPILSFYLSYMSVVNETCLFAR